MGCSIDSEMQMNASHSDRSRPCFLVAPMNRSGTKFFKSLLLGHNEISQGFALEDYAAAYSDDLMEYSESASRHWGRTPEDKAPQRDRMRRLLGDCLIDFFSQGACSTTYLLLTTPRPWGIGNLWRLFPDAKLLILVRDARDCIASANKSFGNSRQHRLWCREWARGAQTILDFAEQHRESQHSWWDFVCFESVLEDRQRIVESCFQFLELPVASYDHSVLTDNLVRGSSWHGGVKSHVRASKNFTPVGRHASWTWFERRAFRSIAGAAYQKLSEWVTTESISTADPSRAAQGTVSAP